MSEVDTACKELLAELDGEVRQVARGALVLPGGRRLDENWTQSKGDPPGPSGRRVDFGEVGAGEFEGGLRNGDGDNGGLACFGVVGLTYLRVAPGEDRLGEIPQCSSLFCLVIDGSGRSGY